MSSDDFDDLDPLQDEPSSGADPGPGFVQRLSPKLTGKQRGHLRSLAHALKPVVLVGQRGVTDTLLENVHAALLAHELIKIKVHDHDDVGDAAEAIYNSTGAQLAQRVGKTLVFYKPHPETPRIALPR